MSKRIMTVDELYAFCLKNKFSKFDSKDFGTELVVEMPANFAKSDDNTDKMTEGLTPFISRAFHDHINLNKSEIKEQDFKDNLPSSNLRPILAHIVKDEKTGELDFGSHDSHVEKVIEIDEDGKEFTVEKVVYDEQPIGVIDGSKTSIEYDEEAKVNRAILHGYLYNEYCQDAIDILNRRGTVDCSVELVIRQMSMDGKTKSLVLNDFYVAGLTLLSAKTKPGMAGSNFKIEDFSLESKTFDFEKQLIEMQAKLNELEARFNINNSMKGGKATVEIKDNKNFEEVTETEKVTETEATTDEVTVSEEESEKTVDKTSEENSVEEKETDEVTTEEVEESADEDTEVKEDNACGGGGSGSKKKKKNSSEESLTNTTVECSYTVNGESKKFAVSLQEKIYAIQDLVNVTYAESDNTYYGVSVYEDYVVMCDYWSGRYFKQSYTSENDNYSLVGDRIEVFAEFVTADEQSKLDDMRSNYSSIVEELNTYKSAEIYADKMTVFDDEAYANYLETDEFKALMSDESVNQYSKEELAEKADATLGKLVKKNRAFSYSENNEKKSNKVNFNLKPDVQKKSKAYGTLFK